MGKLCHSQGSWDRVKEKENNPLCLREEQEILVQTIRHGRLTQKDPIPQTQGNRTCLRLRLNQDNREPLYSPPPG